MVHMNVRQSKLVLRLLDTETENGDAQNDSTNSVMPK